MLKDEPYNLCGKERKMLVILRMERMRFLSSLFVENIIKTNFFFYRNNLGLTLIFPLLVSNNLLFVI